MNKKRAVQLFGSIDPDTIGAVIDQLIELSAESKSRPISLLIHSDGGDLDAAFGLYDFIKFLNVPVHGYVVGTAYSAAVLILQACDRRYMMPHAWVMVHEGSYEPYTTNQTEIMRSIVQSTRMDAEYRRLISERTGLSVDKIRKLEHRATFMDAKEAVKRKFADGILYPSNLSRKSK